MDVKVEVIAMTAGSTIVEPVVITLVAIQETSTVITSGDLSFTVPSVAGHSISAINPEFMKVGIMAIA